MKALVRSKGTLGALFLILGGAIAFVNVKECFEFGHFRISLFFFLAFYLIFAVTMIHSIVTKDDGAIFLAAFFQLLAWVFLDFSIEQLLNNISAYQINNVFFLECAVILIALLTAIPAFFISKKISSAPKQNSTNTTVLLIVLGTIIVKAFFVLYQSANPNSFVPIVIVALAHVAFFVLQCISIAHIKYRIASKTKPVIKTEIL